MYNEINSYCNQKMEKYDRIYFGTYDDKIVYADRVTHEEYSYKNWEQVRQAVEGYESIHDQLKLAMKQISTSPSEEWGPWIGRVVCTEQPANYIEVYITGYEATNELLYEFNVFKENELVNRENVWITVEKQSYQDNVQDAKRIDKGLMKAAAAIYEEHYDTFELYTPYTEYTLENHNEKLVSAGYEPARDRSAYLESVTREYKYLHEELSSFTKDVTEKIMHSNSEWGAWGKQIVSDSNPGLQVEVDITGYERPHRLQVEIMVTRNGEVVGQDDRWFDLDADNFLESLKRTEGKIKEYVEPVLRGFVELKEDRVMENQVTNQHDDQQENWEEFVKKHGAMVTERLEGKQTLVINAFGGAGAGKTTSCLQITEELKKAGYVAEYVPEYAKDLVWDENWEMLNGTQDNQFKILQEQLRRMDRLVGKVDFIVTDAPILLNAVYNKELTASYEKMLSELNAQYKSFNFVVERDASKFEKEGRIHSLEESIEKDGQIKELLQQKGIYFGTYGQAQISKVVNNAVAYYENSAKEKNPLSKENKKDMDSKENKVSENQNSGQRVQSTYKGFAYTKNSDRPQVVYGENKEQIMELLHKWNETRKPGYTYDTCNIGKLNPDTKKYENYEKYDVHSGEEIKKNIYLEMPKGLTKEEFNEVLRTFKENGAKWNPHKKSWYITPDMKEQFKPYIQEDSPAASETKNSQGQVEKRQEENVSKEQKAESPEHSSPTPENRLALVMPKGLTKEEFHQVVSFFKENGAKYYPEEKTWYIQEDNQEKFKQYLPEAESLSIPDSEPGAESAASALGYINNIDVEHYVEVDLNTGERLRINGQDIMKLSGVEKWEELSAGQVVVAVDQKIQEHLKLMDEMKIENLPDEIRVGSTVTFFTPEYQQQPNGFKEICGMNEITGEVKSISAEKYVIADEKGVSIEVKVKEIYDENQADVMKKAIIEEFSAEKMDLVGQPELSAEQMEQVFLGLKDGLNIYQVAMYANSSYSPWQMDVYRYGMNNGISFENVQVVLQNHSVEGSGWEDSKKMVEKMVKAQRNLIIKDFKNHRVTPERHLVKKMERLNGMTGKMHSVNDIMQSLKEGSIPGGDAGKIMENIGLNIKHQWTKMEHATAPVNVPIR